MENSVCPYLQREKIEAKATRKKKKKESATGLLPLQFL